MNHDRETQKAIKETMDLVLSIAQEEGNKIRQEKGREPTEAEARLISEEIHRGLKLALIMAQVEA